MRRRARCSPRCGRSPRPSIRCSPGVRRSRSRATRTSRPTSSRGSTAASRSRSRARTCRRASRDCSRARCRATPRTGRRPCSSWCARSSRSRPSSAFRRRQIEVAMDDWALATVSDLEDKTRVRGVAGALVPAGQNRRRRRRARQPVQLDRHGRARDRRASARRTVRPRPNGQAARARLGTRRRSACSRLALGVTAVFVLVNANGGIPVVSNISASVQGTSVKFTWQNPGPRAAGPIPDRRRATAARASQTGQLVHGRCDARASTSASPSRSTATANWARRARQKCVDVGG